MCTAWIEKTFIKIDATTDKMNESGVTDTFIAALVIDTVSVIIAITTTFQTLVNVTTRKTITLKTIFAFTSVTIISVDTDRAWMTVIFL